MKPLVKLSLISSCALIAVPCLAQTPAQPGGATVVATRPAAESLPKPAVASDAGSAVRATPLAVQLAATARVNAAAPNAVSGRAMFTAAGSVIVLADGKVAHATLAQIQPPAPGFVYER